MTEESKNNKGLFQILGGIGAVIVGIMTVLGIIASISGWTIKDWFQRPEMSYEIISETSFLANPSETSVQLSINNQLYPEAYLYTIKVNNSGGITLSSQENTNSVKDIPITFEFEGQIISTPVIKEIIGNHSPKLQLDKTSVQIISQRDFQPKEGVIFDVIVDKQGINTISYRNNKHSINQIIQKGPDADRKIFGVNLNSTQIEFLFSILAGIAGFLSLLTTKSRAKNLFIKN